jgi:molybdopterin synthase catalytic subunit
MIDIQLLNTPLSVPDCEKFVETDAAGGAVVFIGTVRNKTQSKAVMRLEFEAYDPMAIREIPVTIAVSAAHRGAAFAACAFCIDTLKETVPIWKKEFFEDGDTWVAAHP